MNILEEGSGISLQPGNDKIYVLSLFLPLHLSRSLSLSLCVYVCRYNYACVFVYICMCTLELCPQNRNG